MSKDLCASGKLGLMGRVAWEWGVWRHGPQKTEPGPLCLLPSQEHQNGKSITEHLLRVHAFLGHSRQ